MPWRRAIGAITTPCRHDSRSLRPAALPQNRELPADHAPTLGRAEGLRRRQGGLCPPCLLRWLSLSIDGREPALSGANGARVRVKPRAAHHDPSTNCEATLPRGKGMASPPHSGEGSGERSACRDDAQIGAMTAPYRHAPQSLRPAALPQKSSRLCGRIAGIRAQGEVTSLREGLRPSLRTVSPFSSRRRGSGG